MKYSPSSIIRGIRIDDILLFSQFDSVIKNYSGSSLLYASLPFYFRISKCIKCLSVIKVYECHCKDFFFTALAVPKIKIWANFPHFWLELSEKNKKAAQKLPKKTKKRCACSSSLDYFSQLHPAVQHSRFCSCIRSSRHCNRRPLGPDPLRVTPSENHGKMSSAQTTCQAPFRGALG